MVHWLEWQELLNCSLLSIGGGGKGSQNGDRSIAGELWIAYRCTGAKLQIGCSGIGVPVGRIYGPIYLSSIVVFSSGDLFMMALEAGTIELQLCSGHKQQNYHPTSHSVPAVRLGVWEVNFSYSGTSC